MDLKNKSEYDYEYELLRLIANPRRLNKQERKIQIEKDDLLIKYLKKKYNIYIHSEYINEIEEIIDEKVNDYIILLKSKEIVRECIQNVLEKFDNQVI
jgi:hypothetical protein